MTNAREVQQIFWLGDTLWNLYGAERGQLFNGSGLRLAEWLEGGRATLIKKGAGRTIYRVRLPGRDFFVKHFRPTSLLNRLRQTLRESRADKEFQLAHQLAEAGISTIQPLALGERRRSGFLVESYLLTESISDGITLFEWIDRFLLDQPGQLTGRARFEMTRALARLAAGIHAAGIEHRDLHEKNIIVQPAGATNRLYLLDLHELRVHRALSWPRACRELARMGRYFTLRTSILDRYRFFRHYCAMRGFDSASGARLARAVEKRTDELRADFWRRRDTRPSRKNSRTRAFVLDGTVACAADEIPRQTVERLMRDPDEPFRNAVVHWWKIGRVTRVAEVELPAIRKNQTLIYKQYHFKGWHEALAALVRPNQASRAWDRGAALLLRELPTPRPLVLIHKTRFGLPITSYLITERVPDAVTITRYLDRHLQGAVEPQRRRIARGVLAEAARLLRKMHERRCTHRDLKASNILVSYTTDLARPKMWLIDLDGVETWLEVPRSHRIQNLARFYVSFYQSGWITLTDRLRFLRLYLGRDFHRRGVWKEYWRAIGAKADRKIQRNLRQGRSVV